MSGHNEAQETAGKTPSGCETDAAARAAELLDANKKLTHEIVRIREIERQMRARNEILELLIVTSSRKEYLGAVVTLIREWSGCRCIGIRIANEENMIPYAACNGFSRGFRETESCLSLERDRCTCIRIFTGGALPAEKQALTGSGSFRCDNTFKFMSGLAERERAKFRDTCVEAGFKSLAIVPIRRQNAVIAAIHMADERENMAAEKMVEFIESLTPLIGDGIYRFNLMDDLSRNHELLDRVFSGSDFLIAYLDTGFNFIRVNQTYVEIENRTPDFFAGKNYFDLYPNEETAAIFRNVMETGAAYYAYAQLFAYKGHPERGVTYWNWSLHPVRDMQGRTEGFVLFSVDVTKRKLAEEALVGAQKELAEVKRLSDIGTLAATVAHELRNPLAAVHMAVYNIKRKAQNPALDKHLVTIEKKVSESDQIINNLLFYARIKSPRYESINMYEILRECIALAKGRYRNEKITVIRKFRALKGLLAEADPLQIKEVFSNILNNAYDAIAHQAGTITITAVSDDTGIKVGVTDTGMGIDGHELAQAFEPFFTTKAKGTGLGLSVCRQILNLHGGAIDIASRKGGGTTVTVSLPARKKSYDAKENPHS